MFRNQAKPGKKAAKDLAMPAGSNPVVPENSGVAYPITPDGYYNQAQAFTPAMRKLETVRPPKIAEQLFPTVREGRIIDQESEDADVYYSTQTSIKDMRYSPNDIAARTSLQAYRPVDTYMKPDAKVRKQFLREATARIPRAVIVQERPATNLFQNDDPSQLRLGQLGDDPVSKGRQTEQGEIPQDEDPRNMKTVTRELRRAATVYQRNALLDMIRRGGDYDQGQYPWGLSGVFAKGGNPGSVAEGTGKQIEGAAPANIGEMFGKSARVGIVPALVPKHENAVAP
jgi:hypothetical protein